MIDALHGRPEGTARRQFNANRHRFVDGADFVSGNLDEIRSAFPGAVGSRGGGQVNLLTRRGYMKLVKGFNDDRAWRADPGVVRRVLKSQTPAGAGAMLQAAWVRGPPFRGRSISRTATGSRSISIR